MSEQEALRPGQSFGRYNIVKKLGAGGMGAVYEALHVDLKKRVAIKALAPSMVDNAETRARFLREGEAGARIRHPHVVDIYDVGFLDNVAYLVMEYLEGEDLNARLRREKPLTDQALTEIMLPVCAAVAAAHQQGVIHRDLKPANIFLSRGAMGEIHPKVLDFGISKILADPLADGKTAGLTQTGAVLGTPYYMSPEQAHGGTSLDHRSDQYSLGVILYQCSTGQRPFDAPSMYQVLHKIVQGVFDPPRAIRGDLPEDLERVILKAMARDQEARFPSVLALGAALLPLAGPRARVLWEPIFRAHSWPPPPDQRAITAPGSTGQVEAVAFQEPIRSGSSPRSNTLPAQGDSVSLAGLPRRSMSPVLVAGGAAALALAAAVIWAVQPSDHEVLSRPMVAEEAPVAPPPAPAEAPPAPPAAPAPQKYAVAIAVEPSAATIRLDGAIVGRGVYRAELDKDGAEHTLEISADGYRSERVTFKDAPPPETIALAKVERERPAAAKRPPRPAAKRPSAKEPAEDVRRGANNAPILE
jgi:serine/threonine-protein kinase